MTNLELLNQKISSSDYPIKVIAKRVGISVQSLHNKRCGKREFTVKEILALCEILNLTVVERKKIFSI